MKAQEKYVLNDLVQFTIKDMYQNLPRRLKKLSSAKPCSTCSHNLSTDDHYAITHIVSQQLLDAHKRYTYAQRLPEGTIIPQDEVIRIADFVHNHGLKMHLDGARIWHVAAETGIPLKKLLEPFDSVSLCFSKGLGKDRVDLAELASHVLLGAPIGSCLVGTKDYIRRARWFRKVFGGGMRQTGILAASAAYALTHNFPQLPRVHALARRLEQGLIDLGVRITSHAETCMVSMKHVHGFT